jgi:hypothetical protein
MRKFTESFDPFKAVTYKYECKVFLSGFEESVIRGKLVFSNDEEAESTFKERVLERLKMDFDGKFYKDPEEIKIEKVSGSEQIRPMY